MVYNRTMRAEPAKLTKEQMLRMMREAAANTVKLIAPKPSKPKKRKPKP